MVIGHGQLTPNLDVGNNRYRSSGTPTITFLEGPMFNSLGNRNGITMVEVLISLVLICVGILSLLTLLPSGWRMSATSDSLGRAAAILQSELDKNENLILNENNTVAATPPGNPIQTTVYGSGKDSSQPGDIAYTVQTERVDLGEAGG